jgi:L-aminopeptidase/D-esterase-like protein
MSARRLAALAALVVASVVAITAVREIGIGREEMAQADAASARSDWPAAIAHARAAAQARLPASPWPGRGMLGLQSIGRDAEARGDEENALLAYGALRTAVLATDAPLGTSSSGRWRRAAEDGLARVAASWSLPRAGGAEGQFRLAVAVPPVASQAMVDELRDVHPVPSLTLELVAAASLAAIVVLVRLAATTM